MMLYRPSSLLLLAVDEAGLDDSGGSGSCWVGTQHPHLSATSFATKPDPPEPLVSMSANLPGSSERSSLSDMGSSGNFTTVNPCFLAAAILQFQSLSLLACLLKSSSVRPPWCLSYLESASSESGNAQALQSRHHAYTNLSDSHVLSLIQSGRDMEANKRHPLELEHTMQTKDINENATMRPGDVVVCY